MLAVPFLDYRISSVGVDAVHARLDGARLLRVSTASSPATRTHSVRHAWLVLSLHAFGKLPSPGSLHSLRHGQLDMAETLAEAVPGWSTTEDGSDGIVEVGVSSTGWGLGITGLSLGVSGAGADTVGDVPAGASGVSAGAAAPSADCPDGSWRTANRRGGVACAVVAASSTRSMEGRRMARGARQLHLRLGLSGAPSAARQESVRGHLFIQRQAAISRRPPFPPLTEGNRRQGAGQLSAVRCQSEAVYECHMRILSILISMPRSTDVQASQCRSERAELVPVRMEMGDRGGGGRRSWPEHNRGK